MSNPSLIHVRLEIVDPCHHSQAHLKTWGYPLCTCLDDQTKIVVYSKCWPMPMFEGVMSGMRFKACLDGPPTTVNTGRYKGEVQRKAVSLEPLDMHSHMTLFHLVLGLPNLINQLPTLIRRAGQLGDGMTVYNLMEDIYAGRKKSTDLRISKPYANENVVEEYKTQRPYIQLMAFFPCIPLEAAMELRFVDVDCVDANPWILAKKTKLAKINMLQVADTIASKHLKRELSPSDPKRIEAYIEAAVHNLSFKTPFLHGHVPNVYAKSTWFPRSAIVQQVLWLLDEGPNSWRFDRASLEATFNSTPLPDYLSRSTESETTLYTLAHISNKELEVARILASVDYNEPDKRAIEVLEHLKAYCDLMANLSASHTDGVAKTLEKKLDTLVPRGWRVLYDRMREHDTTQIGVLDTLLQKRVVALVGHAGVGKSSTLATLVLFAQKVLGVELRCVAPTGKARARLQTLIKSPEIIVRTIHSEAANDYLSPGDMYVIDEASMVDQSMFCKLLSKAKRTMRYLVIAGDPGQLPSIDPGSLLRDVLASGVVATTRLTRIYRSDQGSDIAINAPRISDPANRLACADRDGDFAITMHGGGGPAGVNHRYNLAVKKFASFCSAFGDASVIMITNIRNVCNRANKELQEMCNPPELTKPELKRCIGKAPWRIGDRVVNYENQESNISPCGKLHNGQQGKIETIEEGAFVVVFPSEGFTSEVRHRYTTGATDVDHAWCVTAWKFQGDERKGVVVLLPCSWQASNELLYTTVTRATKKVHVFLAQDILKLCLENSIRNSRVTRLRERIVDAFRDAAAERARSDSPNKNGKRAAEDADAASDVKKGKAATPVIVEGVPVDAEP